MKKHINYALLIITILCLVIAIKLSSMPVFEFLPNPIKSFFITAPHTQEQFSFIYDLVMGFILSALFYFIVDVVPEQIKIHKAKKLLSHQVNRLLEYMEQIISIIVSVYERNPNLNELTNKDFLILDGETIIANQEISYLTTTYYSNGKRKTAAHSYGTPNRIIKDKIIQINKVVEQIKNFEYFYSDYTELIEYIRIIESNDLLNWYKSKEKNESPCFLLQGTNKGVTEFTSLYSKIKKLKFNTEYTSTTLDTKSATEKYKQECDDGTLLKHVFDCQQKQQNLAISNPTLIVGSKKYTTGILTDFLSKRFKVTYTNFECLELDKLSDFKYVVFIVDSTTRKFMAYMQSKIKIPVNVILLSEATPIRRSSKKLFKSTNITIIDELFFESGWKFFSIPLNKEEPSEKSIVEIEGKLRSICFNDK